MDPQQDAPRDQFEETPLPPDLEEQPTQAFQPVDEEPKKRHTKVIIIAIVGLVVIITGAAAYIVYSQTADDATVPETTQQTPPPKAISPVDTAADTLVQGLAEEDTITNTDDTTDMDDADRTAGNVGDSINENNL